MLYKIVRILFVGFIALYAGMPARADIALNLYPGNYYAGFNPDVSAGWSFSTNAPIEVNALDAAFVGPGGITVRLYDITGTTLASAVMYSNDPTEGTIVPFFTQPISPVLLAAGQTYFVAEDFPANQVPLFAQRGTIYVDPAINYIGAVDGYHTGTNPTSDTFGGRLNPGIFGPNLDISVAVTPEPGALPLAATTCMGALGLLARVRIRE